eukprot:365535-Chlamydomonas_euryale.AAC.21
MHCIGQGGPHQLRQPACVRPRGPRSTRHSGDHFLDEFPPRVNHGRRQRCRFRRQRTPHSLWAQCARERPRICCQVVHEARDDVAVARVVCLHKPVHLCGVE